MKDSKVISDAVERALRRRQRRKVLFGATLVAILVVAFFLIRCGGGFGVGGKGGGGAGLGLGSGVQRATGPAPAPAIDAGVRCQVRVDADGDAAGADVVVTGDARQGLWDELRSALEAAGVEAFVRGGGVAAPVDAGT